MEIKPESCIKFLVESTNLYTCDIEGYVVRDSNEKIYIMDNEKTSKKALIIPLTVIKDSDAAILNPFNEILGETEDQKWFYITMAMSISFKIKTILGWIIQYRKLKEGVSSKCLKFISEFSDIDQKTKKEIDTITSDMLEFSNIFYNRKLKTSMFRTGIFEENFRSKFSSVRKKTWNVLTRIFEKIFEYDSKTADEFRSKMKFKSNKITCPHFESFLNVYLKVVSYINETCDIFDADEYIVDTDELSFHLNHLDKYYDKLKWMSQEEIAIKNHTQKQINPNIAPIPTNNIQDSDNEGFVQSILNKRQMANLNPPQNQNPFRNQNPFQNNNPFRNQNPFQNNNPFQNDNPFQNNNQNIFTSEYNNSNIPF